MGFFEVTDLYYIRYDRDWAKDRLLGRGQMTAKMRAVSCIAKNKKIINELSFVGAL